MDKWIHRTDINQLHMKINHEMSRTHTAGIGRIQFFHKIFYGFKLKDNPHIIFHNKLLDGLARAMGGGIPHGTSTVKPK